MAVSPELQSGGLRSLHVPLLEMEPGIAQRAAITLNENLMGALCETIQLDPEKLLEVGIHFVEKRLGGLALEQAQSRSSSEPTVTYGMFVYGKITQDGTQFDFTSIFLDFPMIEEATKAGMSLADWQYMPGMPVGRNHSSVLAHELLHYKAHVDRLAEQSADNRAQHFLQKARQRLLPEPPSTRRLQERRRKLTEELQVQDATKRLFLHSHAFDNLVQIVYL